MTLVDETVGDAGVSSGIRGISFAVASPARSNKKMVNFDDIAVGNEHVRYLTAMNSI